MPRVIQNMLSAYGSASRVMTKHEDSRAIVSVADAYIGRFAPTPSGPLHFGSLVAALGSALEAHAQSGRWLLRIDDIDTPRVVAGAESKILRDLERLGFEWHGVPLRQSTEIAAYQAALDRLAAAGHLYGCTCSRKEITDSTLGRSADGAVRYPGTCRAGMAPGRRARATRVRTDRLAQGGSIGFVDRVQGYIEQNLENDVGDFVLHRADGQFAYQLAVVVDDAAQGVTEVVRGADLLDSTPRQIYLQRLLGLPTPSYAHLPVAMDAHGDKLSKQTLAAPISEMAPADALCTALEFLGHAVPSSLLHATVAEVWSWAHANWQLSKVPRVKTLPAAVLLAGLSAGAADHSAP